MKLLPLLLAVVHCSLLVRAARLPWVGQGSYKPDLNARNQASRTRSAHERRASGIDACDPMNKCGIGRCPDVNDCCTTYTPGARRRSDIPTAFRGDILDPAHAVRFLLSDSGTYTHDNGSLIRDHHYDSGRKRALVRHAKRGLLSRAAETSLRSLGAFVQSFGPTSVSNMMIERMLQPDTLLVFSSQTAVDQSDWPEITRLLLQEEWEELTIGAVRVERSTAEFVHAVFEGRVTPSD